MTCFRIAGREPAVSASAWVAPNASVIGDVRLGERSSVWFSAVARGDNEPIFIGADTNVQEGAVLHTDPGFPLTIGDHVTIGHQAMLHGCTVGDGSLIGIQAVVMNNAVIGRHCIVGAGAVVTEGKAFPDRSLILGAPAKLVRQLTDADVEGLKAAAEVYVRKTLSYRHELEALD